MSPSNKAWLSACEAGQGYSTSAEYLQLTTCCHSQPIPAPGVPPAWPGLASFTAEELGLKSPAQDSQLSVCRARPQAFPSLLPSNHVLIQTHSSLLGLSASKPKLGGVGGSFLDSWDQSFNLRFPCPKVGFLIPASQTP